MKMKRWELYPPQEKRVRVLVEELKVHPVVAQVLCNRGYEDVARAAQFLNPKIEDLENPFLLKDMDKAVFRLEDALLKKEKITVYGDYDVDGTTGSSLLYLFFKELGADVEVYIPHRLQEGYGLNFKALEGLREKGRQLVVTVDNGISSLAEAERARELGLDLIIIDHHQVPPQVPFAVAVLNPKQVGCPYPYKELAGVGVAFQLVMAFRSHLRKKGFFENKPEPNLKKYLDLVTLGTIADLVPLTGQNRILVKLGLEVLSETRNLGLIALKEVSGLSGKINPGQVGFRLGPRINAAGRLDSAQVGFELLTSTDLLQAKALAQRLDQANQERQALEEQIVRQACEKVENEVLPFGLKSIVVADQDWHAGVIGIVASRLVDKYYLPALVGAIEGDRVRYSARSIHGLDLYGALQNCAEHLEKFGGHRHAAGLSLLTQNQKKFSQAFDEYVRGAVREEQFSPCIRVDVLLEPDQIESELISQLETLQPFGQGNPEPVFWTKNFSLCGSRLVGSGHLKLSFKTSQGILESIGFGMAEAEPRLASSLQCVFSCQFNEWNGTKRIQLKLSDFPRHSVGL